MNLLIDNTITKMNRNVYKDMLASVDARESHGEYQYIDMVLGFSTDEML